jgi:hypothetical protein
MIGSQGVNRVAIQGVFREGAPDFIIVPRLRLRPRLGITKFILVTSDAR